MRVSEAKEILDARFCSLKCFEAYVERRCFYCGLEIDEFHDNYVVCKAQVCRAMLALKKSI